jgi:hypothetical protein
VKLGEKPAAWHFKTTVFFGVNVADLVGVNVADLVGVNVADLVGVGVGVNDLVGVGDLVDVGDGPRNNCIPHI